MQKAFAWTTSCSAAGNGRNGFNPKCVLSQRTLMLRQVHYAANQQPAVTTAELSPQQQAHLAELQQVFTALEVERLVKSHPAVLDYPTGDWLRFFEGYGLDKGAMRSALRYSMQQLSDPYTAGVAIKWLKTLGPWTDADVANRLLPCYPKVLATPVDDLDALYNSLRHLGFDSHDVATLLWECPGLMADFRGEQLPLITRMVESRRNKYTNGGLYID